MSPTSSAGAESWLFLTNSGSVVAKSGDDYCAHYLRGLNLPLVASRLSRSGPGITLLESGRIQGRNLWIPLAASISDF